MCSSFRKALRKTCPRLMLGLANRRIIMRRRSFCMAAQGCIVMFDGMASLDSLWELLLDAAGAAVCFCPAYRARRPMRISCTARRSRPRVPQYRICRSL